MKKHFSYFVAAFALGCVVALAARSAWFKPYVGHSGHPAAPDYSQRVTNPAAPAADPHAGHEAAPAKPDPAPASTEPTAPSSAPHGDHSSSGAHTTVNTICAICGMDVDPAITPADYQGRRVGFGCRLCPPKFAAEPGLYGPAALDNKVVPN